MHLGPLDPDDDGAADEQLVTEAVRKHEGFRAIQRAARPPRPYANLTPEQLLHVIREGIAVRFAGPSTADRDDTHRLIDLMHAVDELDQQLTAGAEYPSQWREHR
jgi:hypothetical protein